MADHTALASCDQTIEMARIAIRPDWVGVLDFQTRFPSAMQPFLETAAAQATHQAQS